MSSCCCVLDRIEGSTALTLGSGPRLVLIDGGKGEVAERPASARLSMGQILVFMGMAAALTVSLCVAAAFGDARANTASTRALDGLSERIEVVQSGVVPTVRLERIFRQSGQSLIVKNAHRIVEGFVPQKL